MLQLWAGVICILLQAFPVSHSFHLPCQGWEMLFFSKVFWRLLKCKNLLRWLIIWETNLNYQKNIVARQTNSKGNIINDCFDVTAASESVAACCFPIFLLFLPDFSRGRRQRCSDWQRYKKSAAVRARVRTDDGDELMNVIIACIGDNVGQHSVVLAVCSLC